MSNIVISVENLSKQYRLGLIGGATFREEFSRWWAKKLGRPNPYAKIGQIDHGNVDEDGQHIWALRDVSFEVKEGEILGIIGRNGAGKSTLLKILSRIVSPTSGCIKVRGRVASLLEVGTGFHPELTGRENIYLNGAILGMKKVEITRKLDEIIAFSEIEDFIDTPVKRYSSGMTVRLAFAVAAHLEPEILVVDEVLAVGDVAFQKKCLGKMEDVSRGGRTVLFVSHNMNVISSLCKAGILLHAGELEKEGEMRQVIDRYLNTHSSHMHVWHADHQEKTKRAVIHSVQFLNSKKSIASSIRHSENGFVRIIYSTQLSEQNFVVVVRILDRLGTILFTSWDTDDDQFKHPCEGIVECQMPNYMLRPGQYTVIVMIHEIITRSQVQQLAEASITIEISQVGFTYSSGRVGLITPKLVWNRIHSEIDR